MGGSDELFAFEVKEEFVEVFYADECDARDESSLREVGLGEVDFGETGSTGGFDDVNDAVDGAECAIEGEFTDEESVLSVCLG